MIRTVWSEISHFFHSYILYGFLSVTNYLGRFVGKAAEASSDDLSDDHNATYELSRPFNQTYSEKVIDNNKCIMKADQVRILTLNFNEHQNATLYRLKKSWALQFRLGPSLFGEKVDLFCNYPKSGEDFKRNVYQKVEWIRDSNTSCSDDSSLYAEIKIKLAGSFRYYFTCNGTDEQGSGFFLVDPCIKYGNDDCLQLDCIQCQTVLAKSLGKFETWERKLRVAKESGYNMIHFTPIQELGASNSSYSISEQLKLNPLFGSKNFEDVMTLISKMKKEWKMQGGEKVKAQFFFTELSRDIGNLFFYCVVIVAITKTDCRNRMTSICDIVLNHTANESSWLVDHPEATYNCDNCPYMKPAYLLDAALYQFSLDVKAGLYENKGIPPIMSTEDHLNSLRYALHNDLLKNLKLYEVYTCNAIKLVTAFSNLIRVKVPRANGVPNGDQETLSIVQDPQYRRLQSTVDMDKAIRIYNIYRNDCFDEETRIKKCAEQFKLKLDELNQEIMNKLNSDLNTAVENCISSVRYFRIQSDGPKFTEITISNPLFYRYFTDYNHPESYNDHEEIAYSTNAKYLMAHNGWVMNADPLHNFASNASVYLRRELIAWGDSVKLRYGNKIEDSPFLWAHMKEYVELTARIFDGVRLDNCHSTPIHVAEYLLDCARKIKPDLYIVAELFTNSDCTDNIFVNQLGITSLIREAMSAWNSHELGRLVYRYGGEPVGAFHQPYIRPLTPSIAHALFLDLTHDNPSPIEKRTVFDLLPNAALVNMACCASGSNRGYDELVPHHIHVVNEKREYTEWNDKGDEGDCFVNSNSGIISAKKAINELHYYLANNGYNQVFVDQVDEDIVTVTRHNPTTHESVILVAFTCFKQPSNIRRYIKPLRIEGDVDEVIFEISLRNTNNGRFGTDVTFDKSTTCINGYHAYKIFMKEHLHLDDSEIFAIVDCHDSKILQLEFKDFQPGTVVALKVSLKPDIKEVLRDFVTNSAHNLDDIISKLNLSDINRILYRCDAEERDEGLGFSAYNIPNFGSMVYCGLQGVVSLLSKIRPGNDLGHPLCVNLRDGNWLIDYTSDRLKVDDGTKDLGIWIEKNADKMKQLPRYLIPAYFDLFITKLYMKILDQSTVLMSDFIKNGSTFVRSLALSSLQFLTVIKSARLPLLSPNLTAPTPETIHLEDEVKLQKCVSLAAGLPHFSVGYTRNWGRDTFIAIRGICLLPGRHQDARYLILSYAACLRHGLIPNLLDGGKNARYNCRDAIWWWLYSIKCYVEDAPNGESILKDNVSRIYPNDDTPPIEPGIVDQLLQDIVYEALQIHFQGLIFRERNAGRTIDEHMSDRGFNNQIGVHPETGFVFGGNESNCGTWMDKMGSSEKASNRGKPATPRDGSAVEIVGLSSAVIAWLAELNQAGKFPYSSVERKHRNGKYTRWTFKDWSSKIKANFEASYWIGEETSQQERRPELINRRNIFKDCYGASLPWYDYQLRCNFPIAMVADPDLFNPQHAWAALSMCEEYLLGPLGMKTLDPSDWNYNGDYDNSNDSDNSKVAHGFNYHQGPEWLWPIGFFLRAKLIFAAKLGKLKPTIKFVKKVLANHYSELQTSDWRGLPELTNSNGSFCKDSSRTQAWSVACILEVLYDLETIEEKEALNQK